MRIILLTQGKEALVDDQDFDWLNQWSWYALSAGGCYAARRGQNSINKRIHIFMHNVIAERMGLIGSIDHKDRNSLNDQRYNLRVATRTLNGANAESWSNNTSGFKGVSWDKREQKWKASVRFKGHLSHLGYFDCPIEAAKAYDRAAKRLFGEFAVLNFPAD